MTDITAWQKAARQSKKELAIDVDGAGDNIDGVGAEAVEGVTEGVMGQSTKPAKTTIKKVLKACGKPVPPQPRVLSSSPAASATATSPKVVAPVQTAQAMDPQDLTEWISIFAKVQSGQTTVENGMGAAHLLLIKLGKHHDRQQAAASNTPSDAVMPLQLQQQAPTLFKPIRVVQQAPRAGAFPHAVAQVQLAPSAIPMVVSQAEQQLDIVALVP